MDCQLHTAHKPARLESVDSGTVQVTASSPGDIGANSPPGYVAYGHPVFSGVKAKHVAGRDRGGSVQGSMVPPPPSCSFPLRDDSRKKPLAYKSMLVLFYFYPLMQDLVIYAPRSEAVQILRG